MPSKINSSEKLSKMGKFLNLNGTTIHFEDIHQENSVALVFIHGRTMSLRIWEQQLGSDLLAGNRLIAMDLPGHGLSGHSSDPMEDYSIHRFIEAIRDLVEELGLTHFLLVGLSMGGHFALEALPHLPGCKGVMAITMPITKPAAFERMYLQTALMGRVYSLHPVSTDVSSLLRLFLSSKAPEFPAFAEEDFYRADPRIHDAITASIVRGDYADETEIIRNSKVPVALVAGLDDQIHDLTYLDNFTLPLWQNKVLEIRGGHSLCWENAEALNPLLASFAAQCGN